MCIIIRQYYNDYKSCEFIGVYNLTKKLIIYLQLVYLMVKYIWLNMIFYLIKKFINIWYWKSELKEQENITLTKNHKIGIYNENLYINVNNFLKKSYDLNFNIK